MSRPRDHAMCDALADSQSAKPGNAVLSGYHVDIAAGGRHQAREVADYSRNATLADGRQREDRNTTLRLRCRPDEIDLPCDRADVIAADGFGRRRAPCDHIASAQSDCLADVSGQRPEREHHVRGRTILHRLPVQRGGKP